MCSDLTPQMLASCKDSRSCNKVLREHGITKVMFQAIPTREPRTMYGLFILGEDHYWREIYRSDKIRDCIIALGYY